MRRPFFIRKKYWPIVVVILILIVAAGQHFGWITPAGQGKNSAQPGYYSVKYDIDGDTIVVNTPSGTETVRFIGVDTPETHDPRKPVQCYGPIAAAYTKSQVEGKTVRLVADPTDTNRDRYDRLLRYVYLPDGTLLNLKLIQTGHGFYYPFFPFSKKTEFAAAEKQAQSQKLGLWGKCQPIPEDQDGFTSPAL